AERTESTLWDAAHLQKEDANFANKKGYSKHKPALPLYTTADAEKAARQLRSLEYGQVMDLSEDTRVSIRDAGHILGSGIVQADLRAGSKPLRGIFSGDLGRYDTQILRDPGPSENTH